MKAKQLIERSLKFNNQYIYLGITRGSIESAQLTCCDNCGKLITNMVSIANRENKQRFTIGTDCAETLSQAKCLYNNGQQTDFYIDIYAYNKTTRFATELRKGKKYENNGIFLTVLNDKGKQIDCFLGDLQKFYPELI